MAQKQKTVFVCQEEWFDDGAHDVNEPVAFATIGEALKWREAGIDHAVEAQGIVFSTAIESAEDWHRTNIGYYHGKLDSPDIWYHWNITMCDIKLPETPAKQKTKVRVCYYKGDEDPSSGEITYTINTDNKPQALKTAIRKVINNPPPEFTGIDSVHIVKED